MNMLVSVSYVVLVIFFVLRYLNKQEPSLVLFFRMVSMVVCLVFPIYYYMISSPKEFSELQTVLTGVLAVTVYNFLFSIMLHEIKQSVDKVMIADAVKDRAEIIAEKIIADRDEIITARDKDEFERQRQEQLKEVVARDFEIKVKEEVDEAMISEAIKARAEHLAEKIVTVRDQNEFNRQRQEQLKEVVARDFESEVNYGIASRDQDEFNRQRQERLKEVVARDFEVKVKEEAEKLASQEVQARFTTFANDPKYAIWIGLHGASKALGYSHADDEVLAIPYWVEYKLGEDPMVRRYNTCRATVRKLYDVVFMSKQWAKVEGREALVVGNALISGVNK